MEKNLFYAWEESVENFLSYAVLCCGIEQDSNEYNLLQSVVTTQSELERFVELYEGDINHLDYTAAKMLAEDVCQGKWEGREMLSKEITLLPYRMIGIVN